MYYQRVQTNPRKLRRVLIYYQFEFFLVAPLDKVPANCCFESIFFFLSKNHV